MAKLRRAQPLRGGRKWTALPIDEWLTFLGQTKAWLAAQTGYSEPYISLIASGKKRYNQDNIERISTALGIHPSQLHHKPTEQDFWSVWATLDTEQRRRAAAMVKAFRDAG